MKQSNFVILPDSEEDLFKIKQYPLFDMKLAVDILGDETIAKTIFQSFYQDNKKDLQTIKAYFDKRDWDHVQMLAHKLKSSALFGTLRLHFALSFLEQYLKAGHRSAAEKLYIQMAEVMAATLHELKNLALLSN